MKDLISVVNKHLTFQLNHNWCITNLDPDHYVEIKFIYVS